MLHLTGLHARPSGGEQSVLLMNRSISDDITLGKESGLSG